MPSLKIVGLCVLFCVVYGVLHDQVTARVCIEYFTIGHVPVLPPEYETPTNLAFAWGVIATWWVGVLLGIPLAVACRAGGLPKRSVGSLVRPLLVLAGCSAALATTAGLIGWTLARQDAVVLLEPMASRVPEDRQVAFLTDLWAHSASYLSGFMGAIVLIVSTLRWRWRASQIGAASQAESDG